MHLPATRSEVEGQEKFGLARKLAGLKGVWGLGSMVPKPSNAG